MNHEQKQIISVEWETSWKHHVDGSIRFVPVPTREPSQSSIYQVSHPDIDRAINIPLSVFDAHFPAYLDTVENHFDKERVSFALGAIIYVKDTDNISILGGTRNGQTDESHNRWGKDTWCFLTETLNTDFPSFKDMNGELDLHLAVERCDLDATKPTIGNTLLNTLRRGIFEELLNDIDLTKDVKTLPELNRIRNAAFVDRIRTELTFDSLELDDKTILNQVYLDPSSQGNFIVFLASLCITNEQMLGLLKKANNSKEWEREYQTKAGAYPLSEILTEHPLETGTRYALASFEDYITQME